MTGHKSRLIDFVSKEEEYVTFGDNNKERIMGEGNIGNQHKTQIKNVPHVDKLKHNLLSISQLCDKGFKIEFNKNCRLICEAKSSEVVHIGKRIGNIYMLNIKHTSFHELSCLVSKIDDSWLWHRRVGHINMHHLNHLVKKDLVIGDVAPCKACRPWIFFINGGLCFLKINGGGMEKEER